MNRIDIFYQREGVADFEHVEIDPNETFAGLKAHLIKRHTLAPETLLFVEDSDEPTDEATPVRHCAGASGIKAQLHRCRHVHVSVTFNCETVEHDFAPSTTVARVKRWAAERKFGMSAEEAGEHVLQIVGTQDRPRPGTHVGALVKSPHCHVEFDLVPDERINGADGDLA